jgi:hypothetical protein
LTMILVFPSKLSMLSTGVESKQKEPPATVLVRINHS